MTRATLRNYTCKDLAQMAKQQGVPGWHSMRKDELVTALVRAARRKTKKKSSSDTRRHSPADTPKNQGPNGSRRSRRAPIKPAPSSTNPRTLRKIHQLQEKLKSIKNLGTDERDSQRVERDRLVVMVRDSYWLHAYWEISAKSVSRAQAAMGTRWHAARPVLRVIRRETDGAESISRDIEIHGGVNNWYVDVQDPPCGFRMEIGYLAAAEFYCLARSNSVTTPPSGTSDSIDENWSDVAAQADRIFAMSGGYSKHGTSLELQELLEERLRRPMGSPMQTRFGAGASGQTRELPFAVDAEIIVYGICQKDAHVTLKGEPVQLRADGSFAVRLDLPDRRQVIPVVASSSDGVEQRTIVLAVERNTKAMEPIVRDVAK